MLLFKPQPRNKFDVQFQNDWIGFKIWKGLCSLKIPTFICNTHCDSWIILSYLYYVFIYHHFVFKDSCCTHYRHLKKGIYLLPYSYILTSIFHLPQHFIISFPSDYRKGINGAIERMLWFEGTLVFFRNYPVQSRPIPDNSREPIKQILKVLYFVSSTWAK